MRFDEDVPVKRKISVRAVATERRQREIMAAAVAAFADSGFAGASLRDIATRAGLSHQGLLHHFPDKSALLEAVLDDGVAQTAADYKLDTGSALDLFRGLLGVAERDARDLTRMRMMFRLSVEATAPVSPAHNYYRRWYADVRERLTEALLDLQAAGRYHGPVPPATAVLHLTAVRDGLTLQHLLEPSVVDFAAELRRHLAVYIDLD